MKIAIFLCCVAVVVVQEVVSLNQKQQYLEMEYLLNTTQYGRKERDQASNNNTLRVVDTAGTQTMVFDVCLKPESGQSSVNVVIDTIQYSNDGGLDTVSVTLNGTSYGNVTIPANDGQGTGWNVFKNTGRFGTLTTMPEGNYTMVLTATTDTYGLELDLIRIYTENQEPIQDIFCGQKVFNNS